MKYSLVFFLTIFSATAFSGSVIDKADNSVVYVSAPINKEYYARGTGFVVGSGGVVATNYHVISDAKEIYLLTKQEGERPQKHQATILWSYPEIDIAILSAPTLNAPPLILMEGLPSKGLTVVAIGYPGVADENAAPDRLESTATQGIVSRVFKSSWYKGAKQIEIVQHSAPINKGNSGGPLIDSCGRVIGMNTQKTLGEIVGNSKQGFAVSQSDGISFAINSSELISILKSRGIIGSITSAQCNEGTGYSTLGIFRGTSWMLIVGILGAIGLAGGSLFIALRKPAILSESYTQYIRRSNPSTTVAHPTKKSADWNFVGKTEDGTPIRLKISKSSLESRNLMLGRDSSGCDLVVNDPSVSRRHAILSLVAGRLMLSDGGSTNGTYIDGVKVTEQPVAIKIGQRLLIGKVSIMVEEA